MLPTNPPFLWAHQKKTWGQPGKTGGSGQSRRHQIEWTFAEKVGPGGGVIGPKTGTTDSECRRPQRMAGNAGGSS